MVTHILLVKNNRYLILVNKPKAWQFNLPANSGINRKDNILIKEVDNNNVPTGKEKRGVVEYINASVDVSFLNGDILYYICPVLEGVGDLTIGGTFIIN
jgi:hypothetical protein